MKSLVLMMVLLVSAVCMLSCSDDDPVQPAPTEKGPFVIDFEDRPDDGLGVGKTPPITIAPGVTVSAVLPSGVFQDFKNSDGFQMGGCLATVISDSMMIGFEGVSDVTAVFTFASAVSRVDAFVGGENGRNAILTAFDSSDNVVGADTVASVCPILDPGKQVSISVGSNRITKLELRGGQVPVMDDLSYYRFE